MPSPGYNADMNADPPALNPPPMDAHIRELIGLAVTEDIGHGSGSVGDPTTELSIDPHWTAAGALVARQSGVVAGTFLIPEILAHYSKELIWKPLRPDGEAVASGTRLGVISGPVQRLLSAERVVLNFVSHLSGVATLTRAYVDCARSHAPVAGKPVICDTRKTMPGFRVLEKYAVRCGGGINHRMALFDGVMLKDNHIAALTRRFTSPMALTEIVRHVRNSLPQNMRMWLEIDSLDQLPAAIAGGPDIILLDNMSAKEVKRAVHERDRLAPDGRPLLEASGGIHLENLPDYARTGVDRISIGAITHSAPILDVGFDMEPDRS
ncbi:MAG: carboxylating nicotinate-nucleotide diphosphorylase [Phycisphaerae bacterium]